MAENHLKKKNTRPKRRRDKDNPYEIFTTGMETGRPRYYVRFRDGERNTHTLEISQELFEAFNQFELEDLSFLNEVDRHYDRAGEEGAAYQRIRDKALPVEDQILRELFLEDIRRAIASLPDTQRRRLVLHCFGGFTYREIAREEGCSAHSVYMSVARAKEKIKILMKQV